MLAGSGGRGWQREDGPERLARVTFGTGGDLLGRPSRDNSPTPVAGVGAQANDPIGELR